MAWSDILGQDLAKRMFQTHLSSGKIPGAYLLVGPEGIGKRRLALEMAKALNCTAKAERPCDACPTCGQINRSTHPDVHVVVGGGASDQIKIDQIRHIIGRIALRPFSAAMQVVVIDGADRLTEEAANSLLKVLEEPSPYTRFVLTSAHLQDCLPTIISRCQLIRCLPLPAEVVADLLTKADVCAPPVAAAIARLCAGSMASAEQLAGGWDAYTQVLERLADPRPAVWLEQPLPESREDVGRLLDVLLGWLRDVAVAAAADPSALVHTAHAPALTRQAQRVDVDRCIETALELVTLRDSLEQFANAKLVAALAREKWLSLADSRHDA